MYMGKEVRQDIRLNNASDVHEFVKLADACDFDVNIGYGRVQIDGKSIMGVMGLDLGKVLTVHYTGDNDAMDQFVARHAIAK